MLVKPGTFSVAVADDGFTYYSLDAGSVPAGQTVEVVISYDKTTDELSNSSMRVEPSEPLSSDTAGRNSLTSALPFVLGLAGAGADHRRRRVVLEIGSPEAPAIPLTPHPP